MDMAASIDAFIGAPSEELLAGFRGDQGWFCTLFTLASITDPSPCLDHVLFVILLIG